MEEIITGEWLEKFAIYGDKTLLKAKISNFLNLIMSSRNHFKGITTEKTVILYLE